MRWSGAATAAWRDSIGVVAQNPEPSSGTSTVSTCVNPPLVALGLTVLFLVCLFVGVLGDQRAPVATRRPSAARRA